MVNEGEGENKKIPTPECYESGEVRDGMKKREFVTQNHAANSEDNSAKTQRQEGKGQIL